MQWHGKDAVIVTGDRWVLVKFSRTPTPCTIFARGGSYRVRFWLMCYVPCTFFAFHEPHRVQKTLEFVHGGVSHGQESYMARGAKEKSYTAGSPHGQKSYTALASTQLPIRRAEPTDKLRGFA